MRLQRQHVLVAELVLGIATLIVALPIGTWFDRPAITFEAEHPLALDQWEEAARSFLARSQLDELPNVVQIFHIENVSSSSDVADLRYDITVPGQIRNLQLRKGADLVTNARWERGAQPDRAALVIDRVPPGTRVTAAVLYRSFDETPLVAMSIPLASASGIEPERLVLAEGTVSGSMRWIVTASLWVLATGLLVIPYRSMRSQLRGAMSRAARAEALEEQLREYSAEGRTGISIVNTWERVALSGVEFATTGADLMYWFRVPLGGVSYKEGFTRFLAPAMENPKITRVRFVLDSTRDDLNAAWAQRVLPLLRSWADEQRRVFRVETTPHGGRFVEAGSSGKAVEWIRVNLSEEFSPPFKLFVDDAATEAEAEVRAQVFVAFATRKVQLDDGVLHDIRIPTSIVHVEGESNAALLQQLCALATRWDSLFDER